MFTLSMKREIGNSRRSRAVACSDGEEMYKKA